jgi:uncharacterized protein YecE (DUF72 family)
VRIGCSGWSYDHWVGVLYPPGLPKARWRDAYAARFDTVELNASYHRWPGVRPFQGWSRSLPPGFAMAIKASRWISHARRLRDPDGAWAARLTAAHDALDDRAGPVLVQLHHEHVRDEALLEEFLGRIPERVPVAVELRHPSWQTDAVLDVLARQRAAYVVTDGVAMPTARHLTAPFAYVRLHGPTRAPLYTAPYSEEELLDWAGWARDRRAEGRDVWIYFNNDIGGHAVRNAERLRQLVG